MEAGEGGVRLDPRSRPKMILEQEITAFLTIHCLDLSIPSIVATPLYVNSPDSGYNHNNRDHTIALAGHRNVQVLARITAAEAAGWIQTVGPDFESSWNPGVFDVVRDRVGESAECVLPLDSQVFGHKSSICH